MAQQILHPQYRAQLRPNPYPFADAATLVSDTGAFLPASLFEDALLYPPGNHTGLYLSQVTVGNDAVVISISNTKDVVVGTATSPLFDPDADVLTVADEYGRKVGVLVSSIEELSAFQAWAPGSYLFTAAQTEFAAGVCIPTPEVGLRGIVLEDGTLFAGDVWIVGGAGVVVRHETVSIEADCDDAAKVLQGIRIDIVGDPLFRRRLCANFQTPRFLTELVLQYGCERFSVVPDTNGNISLTAGNHAATDSVLRVQTSADGITIEAAGRSIVQ